MLRINSHIKMLVSLILIFLSFTTSAFAISDSKSENENFGYPLKSTKIVRGFSKSTSIYSSGSHLGVDFEATIGTPIYAVADGQVTFSGQVNNHLFISIDHGNNFVTTYSVGIKSLKVLDIVKKGQKIGNVGKPLTKDSENTFHLSMRIAEKYVDPMLYISGKIPVREISLTEISDSSPSLLEKLKKLGYQMIKTGLSSNNYVLDIAMNNTQNLYDWMMDDGGNIYDGLIKTGRSTWGKWIDTYDKVKNLTIKAKSYLERGLTDLYKATMNKINKLSDELYKLGNNAIQAIDKIDDFLISVVEKAYSISKEFGDWTVIQLKEKIQSAREYISSYVKALLDPIMALLNSSKKLLDEFYNISDKWKDDPISCLLRSNCGLPIEVACDIRAKDNEISTKSDGYKGSGNTVFFVSGLNTKGDFTPGGTKPIAVPYKKLGYSDDDVDFYSYAGNNQAFDEQDTYQDINLSAELMDQQIKLFTKKHPGEKMDLIAHSLGGAVASVWLAKYYDANDKSYPKLGKIIFYAVPLGGTSAANVLQEIDNTIAGSNVKDILSLTVAKGLLPPSKSTILEQLSEGGYVSDIIKASGVTKKYKIYDLQYGSDYVVSAATVPVDGVENVVLGEDWKDLANSHSSTVTSDNSVSQTQRILADKKVACPSLATVAKFSISSTTVHMFETNLSALGI